MPIGWPLALVLISIVVFIGTVIIILVGGRMDIAKEDAKGKSGDQYRMLASNYENLAKETRDFQAAMRSDLEELRRQVESIERKMREAS